MHRKKILLFVNGFFILVCTLFLFRGILLSERLSVIYDLPENELLEHLDTYTVLLSSTNQISDGAQYGGRFKRLSGAMPIGELNLKTDSSYSVYIHSTHGAGKVFFISKTTGEFISASDTGTAVFLKADSYQIYCIGSKFWGSIELILC